MWADALNVDECRGGGGPGGRCIKFLLLTDKFLEHVGHDLRNLCDDAARLCSVCKTTPPCCIDCRREAEEGRQQELPWCRRTCTPRITDNAKDGFQSM